MTFVVCSPYRVMAFSILKLLHASVTCLINIQRIPNVLEKKIQKAIVFVYLCTYEYNHTAPLPNVQVYFILSIYLSTTFEKQCVSVRETPPTGSFRKCLEQPKLTLAELGPCNFMWVSHEDGRGLHMGAIIWCLLNASAEYQVGTGVSGTQHRTPAWDADSTSRHLICTADPNESAY